MPSHMQANRNNWENAVDGNMAHAGKDNVDHFKGGMHAENGPQGARNRNDWEAVMDGKMVHAEKDTADHFGAGMKLRAESKPRPGFVPEPPPASA